MLLFKLRKCCYKLLIREASSIASTGNSDAMHARQVPVPVVNLILNHCTEQNQNIFHASIFLLPTYRY
jgi:hypothetical protein